MLLHPFGGFVLTLHRTLLWGRILGHSAEMYVLAVPRIRSETNRQDDFEHGNASFPLPYMYAYQLLKKKASALFVYSPDMLQSAL